MWKLLYEDTFGFGEDRDPIRVESCGPDDLEGFKMLWDSVLRESLTGTADKPVTGFARFTLVITGIDGKSVNISINTEKYLYHLAAIKSLMNSEYITGIASRHYDFFMNNKDAEFDLSLIS
ncbi:MAG: hypothetical protein CVV49_11705 [Spirochaetae bacterium HGW-Spirochaetae-5]|nr:MAG: hypothetical protein CVV49_11705 [Spirochaetae bacterium HGW-Spirochaetae-5]